MTIRTVTRDPQPDTVPFRNSSAIQYKPNATVCTECRVSPPLHEITRIVKEIIPDPRDEFAEYEVFIQVIVKKPIQ